MFELRKLSKTLGDFNLTEIDFALEPGDYCAVLGVSGAGKTVLLELIAGMLKPDRGDVVLNGQVITQKKIQERGIGLLFQDYAVFPHLTVKQNVMYSQKLRRMSAAERDDIVQAMAAQMGITPLLNRMPETLSGGELQRTALARTLVTKPEILLLDEPLAALDSLLKSELKALLRQINRSGQTIIHVTHDYSEVLSLANKVVVIENGVMQQFGTPEEVFRTPRSKFIAHLSGIKNFFKAVIETDEPTGERVAVIDNKVRIFIPAEPQQTTGHIIIGSDEIILSEEKIISSAANNFEGVIMDVVPVAVGVEAIIDIGIQLYVTLTQSSTTRLTLQPGGKIWVCFKASGVKFTH